MKIDIDDELAKKLSYNLTLFGKGEIGWEKWQTWKEDTATLEQRVLVQVRNALRALK